MSYRPHHMTTSREAPHFPSCFPLTREQSATFLVLLAYLLSGGVFTALLISTRLLPGRYTAILVGLLALGAAGLFLLLRNMSFGKRYYAGVALCGLCCLIFGTGIYYLTETMDTAHKVTTVEPEVVSVGIFVRADDTRDFNALAGSYVYGVAERIDRANTQDTVKAIQEEYGRIQVRTFPGLTQLLDGVLDKQVDAIILNSAYLPVVEDMEGYAGVSERLREVKLVHLERTPAPTATPRPRPTPRSEEGAPSAKADQVFTVLLSGIDTRGELTDSSRSDVNILAVVNATQRKVALISTPRDYYIPLPVLDGELDKLTHAGLYGVGASMDAIAELYDVDVDYYFRVNFGGFVNIINALGGITVQSDLPFSIDKYTFQAGENDLDGEAALMFVRERHSFEDGDVQRNKNQLAVLRAVIQKAMSPELLLNYTNVLNAVEGSFETSIPYEVLSGLVRDQLDRGGSWEIESYTVNGAGDTQVPYSLGVPAYVMQPDEKTVEHAKEMIQAALS